MPRFEKWLMTAAPDAPADQVARAAIAERLLAVSYFLDRALGGSDETEAIHQLRVWTRRASAAMKLFEQALPNSRRRRMKKALRKFRRAAGEVRDCDIQIERLAHNDVNTNKRLIRALKRDRAHARRKLKRLRRRWQRDSRLDKQIEQLLENIAWPKRHSSREAPAFGPFCRQQLAPVAAEFFRLADANLNDNDALHALRIAGKRLRYALELAPTAMPTQAHRRLYDHLNKVQDRLGEVCDQLATIDFTQRSLDDTKKKRQCRRLVEQLKREQRRLTGLRTAFLRWWPAARKRVSQQWDKAAGKARASER